MLICNRKLSEFLVGIPVLLIGSIIAVVLLRKETIDIFKLYEPISLHESVNITVNEIDSYKGATLILSRKGRYLSIDATASDDWDTSLYNIAKPGDSISLESGKSVLYLFKDMKRSARPIEFNVTR